MRWAVLYFDSFRHRCCSRLCCCYIFSASVSFILFLRSNLQLAPPAVTGTPAVADTVAGCVAVIYTVAGIPAIVSSIPAFAGVLALASVPFVACTPADGEMRCLGVFIVSLHCLYITFCCGIHSVSEAPPVGGFLAVCLTPATSGTIPRALRPATSGNRRNASSCRETIF
jgi:hypothetical protein